MRHIIFTIAVVAALSASAITKPKVYMNPGHGGWSPNDRPLATISHPMLPETGRPDTCGFYESNTNLWKIEELGRILKSSNEYYLKYSRKANGPYPWVKGGRDEFKYDRELPVISEEVDGWRADYFISVHSNAAADGALANYPLFLYRGTDADTGVKDSRGMCAQMWPFHTEAMKAKFEFQSAYTGTATNIRGDRSFYNYTWQNTHGYFGYLGVLMHGCPGYLVEGYFHTYQPSRHRALNPDWCRMEGRRYARGIIDYFKTTPDSLGCIMGDLRSKTVKTDGLDYYAYSSNTYDGFMPLNGATVRLKDNDGNILKIYKVDDNYNGIFVFTDLKPGTYYVDTYCPGYRTSQSKVSTHKFTVAANKTTYKTIQLYVGTSADLIGPTTQEELEDAIYAVKKEEPLDRYSVRVYDASGRYVLTTTRQELESASLPAGLYVLQGSNGVSAKYRRK